jgi:hypothetical protein
MASDGTEMQQFTVHLSPILNIQFLASIFFLVSAGDGQRSNQQRESLFFFFNLMPCFL